METGLSRVAHQAGGDPGSEAGAVELHSWSSRQPRQLIVSA